MRVLVVDDEAPARRKLLRLLAEEPEVEVVGEADNGPDAVAAIEALAPDLVLLDVQMPGLDGFGVVEALDCDPLPRVVFVTAFDRYALRAFEVHALDYLLKPVSPERFRTALDRARAALAPSAPSPPPDLGAAIRHLLAETREAARPLTRVLVRARGRAFFVRVDDVARIDADRNYLDLYAGGERYTVRGTLSAMADRLDPERFVRVNKSSLVNLDHVRELRPWSHGEYVVVLSDGGEVTTSRRFREALPHLFGQRL